MAKIDAVIKAFIIDCKSRRLTEKTVNWYSNMLSKFSARFPDDDIKSITPTMIRLWVIDMADAGLSGATQHAYARSVKAMMNFAELEGYLPEYS